MTSTHGSENLMDEPMTLSSEPEALVRLVRFTIAERWTHRTLGILMGALLLTAAMLYIPDISAAVGNRPLIRNVHVISGFLLPLPLIIASFFWAFRQDVGILNRFTPNDWAWLKSRKRRSGEIPVGKFNAGQKLNSAFTLGAIIVMLGTGLLMYFNRFFADDLRTGATFVHDWLTILVAVVAAGHIWMAYSDATARRGMRIGSVPVEWAEREHGQWATEESNRGKS